MKRSTAFLALSVVILGFAGCGKSAEMPATSATQVSTDSHSHDGWWCNEHGIPEESCALCDPKVAAACKDKGDWCRYHELPDSQCFVCHPEHAETFAALYEAKYGHAPPPRKNEQTN